MFSPSCRTNKKWNNAHKANCLELATIIIPIPAEPFGQRCRHALNSRSFLKNNWTSRKPAESLIRQFTIRSTFYLQLGTTQGTMFCPHLRSHLFKTLPDTATRHSARNSKQNSNHPPTRKHQVLISASCTEKGMERGSELSLLVMVFSQSPYANIYLGFCIR